MDALETLVRDVLREHAAEAPTVLPELRPHSPRRWLYAAAAAMLVAGLAVAVVALRRDSSTGQPVAPPSGYKFVSYHGITVAVPENLSVGRGRCSSPGVLVYDPAVTYTGLCPVVRGSGPHIVVTERLPIAGTGGGPPPTKSVVIDGTRGARGKTFLNLSDPDVDISTAGLAPSVAAAVLDSVRITPVDRLGCSQHPPTAEIRTALGAPERAVVCAYAKFDDGWWLWASARASVTQARRLAAARAGLTQSPGGTVSLRLSYSNGSIRVVFAPWQPLVDELVR